MARESITAGASTLAAMGQNVANMGQIRQNMIAGTTQALNNVGNSFLQWQDDFNKRKYQKWMQGMEEAKHAHQVETDKAKIDLSQQSLDIEKDKLSYWKANMQADTAHKKMNTATGRFNLGVEKDKWNYVKKNNLMGDAVRSQINNGSTSTSTTTTGTTPNSNATNGTGNGTGQGNGNGVNTGNSNSAMGILNWIYSKAQKPQGS